MDKKAIEQLVKERLAKAGVIPGAIIVHTPSGSEMKIEPDTEIYVAMEGIHGLAAAIGLHMVWSFEGGVCFKVKKD